MLQSHWLRVTYYVAKATRKNEKLKIPSAFVFISTRSQGTINNEIVIG